jgi:CheY-like chemotaxis protein
VADDDPDDRLMTRAAFEQYRLSNALYFVEDGEQLMDFLHQRGKYAAPDLAPRPGLILLDLNMPRKDGREALAEIKQHPLLRTIPTVVLTTSQAEQDIVQTYNLGVNSFITKPVTFEQLVQVIRVIGRYWIEIVELPDMRAA